MKNATCPSPIAGKRVAENVGDLLLHASDPFTVLVDGKAVGKLSEDQNELRVRDLATGEREVTLKRFGYADIVLRVNVERSATADEWPDTSSAKPVFWHGEKLESSETFTKSTWRFDARSRTEGVTVSSEALNLDKVPFDGRTFCIAGVHQDFFSLTFASGQKSLSYDLYPNVGERTAVSLDFAEGGRQSRHR